MYVYSGLLNVCMYVQIGVVFCFHVQVYRALSRMQMYVSKALFVKTKNKRERELQRKGMTERKII